MAAQGAGPGAGPAAGGPVGVRGWLLFLVILLLVARPVFFVASVFDVLRGWETLATAPGNAPYLGGRLGLEALVTLLAAVAGYRVLKLKPGAIRLCKVALSAILVVTPAELFLARAFLAGESFAAEETELLRAAFRTTLFAAVWLSYLQTSRRVRNTFPPPGAPAAPAGGAGAPR